MNIRKNIKSISIIGLLALGIICFGVHYFANQSKRELEKQILAMDGMNINLEFDNAEAFYRGVDSVYTPRSVKKTGIICRQRFMLRMLSKSSRELLRN